MNGRDTRSSLVLEGLRVEYHVPGATLVAVQGIDFSLRAGESIGLVGESGSGKSSIAQAIMGLLPPAGRISHGKVLLDGFDIAHARPSIIRKIRGGHVGMVFQDPTAALNPVFRVGSQIIDTMLVHRPDLHRRDARLLVVELVESLGFPGTRLSSYPHQLSGGMRQRALIAAAMCAEPSLLIADEPTSDLDTITQAQILELLKGLQRDRGLGILLISHDLGVINAFCDRVMVMHRGVVVESGTTAEVLRYPKHAYTAKLVQASRKECDDRGRLKVEAAMAWEPSGVGVPASARPGGEATIIEFSSQTGPDPAPDGRRATLPGGGRPGRANGPPLLRLRGVCQTYIVNDGWIRRRSVEAVQAVDLDIHAGEILALVGQSGSGKTTLGRIVVGLLKPTRGSITFGDTNIESLNGRSLRDYRRHAQIIFQNPYLSLNPRLRVGDAIAEVLRVWRRAEGAGVDKRVRELLGLVNLPEGYEEKYPHELSGGQRQRVAIARAMAVEPRLLVADEPVSGVDVIAAARIANLLLDLRDEFHLTCLFITHDLGLAGAMGDRVAVMHRGRIVEIADAASITKDPKDPYTRELLNAHLPIGDTRY